MIEIGTKVINKTSNQNGIITSKCNLYELHPSIYKEKDFYGYEVITDDGIHHICLEEDFIVVE